MRSRMTTLLAVIGATTILTLAANSVVMAATGSGFILGKSNSASTITSLTRTTAGPALNLKTRTSGSAPFTTNARGQVANLNASMVGGKTASSFAPASSGLVARAVVNASGQMVASTGIATFAWSSTSKVYTITLKAGPFNYNDYAVSVTPNCSADIGSYDYDQGALIIGFLNGSSSDECGFSLLVFRSH